DRFDRVLACNLRKRAPNALLLFSDVGSRHTLPACRRLGVRSVLSVVHGDPYEELSVLRREAERSPDFFPLYSSNGRLDLKELGWLHERRKIEAMLADLILAPSRHIAQGLLQRGIEKNRIQIIPYAADLNRFRPVFKKPHDRICT